MTLGEPFEHQFYHLKREKCEPTSKDLGRNGRSPTKGTMKRLTQGMGCPVQELRLPVGPDLCQGPGDNDPHEQAGRVWGPGAILRCQLPVGKKVGRGGLSLQNPFQQDLD